MIHLNNLHAFTIAHVSGAVSKRHRTSNSRHHYRPKSRQAPLTLLLRHVENRPHLPGQVRVGAHITDRSYVEMNRTPVSTSLSRPLPVHDYLPRAPSPPPGNRRSGESSPHSPDVGEVPKKAAAVCQQL